MAVAGFQTAPTVISHSLSPAPNFGLLQTAFSAPYSPVRSTFDLSKYTRPTNGNLMSPAIANNCTQPLLPLFSLPFAKQYPVNLISGNKPFLGEVCPSCSKIYKSKKDLQDHVIVHHDRKFECERCTRTFVSEKRMRAHELKKHSVEASNFLKGGINGNRKLFQCSQCDRTYETFYNFKEHLAKHKGKLFRCTICNKHLSGQSALSRHSKIHEKPHECMMCSSRFSSAYDLDCHFSYYHSSVKRFKCFHCDRVLYNYSGKLRHERLCSLKRPIIQKTPADSAVDVIQETLPNFEEPIRAVPKDEETMNYSDDDKQSIILNPSIVNAMSKVKSGMCETAASGFRNDFSSGTKSQRRKTFHICDIMHDVPGFLQ